MDVDEYLACDATTLARLVADRDVAATDLLALARRRRDEVNGAINAVVLPLDDVADVRACDVGLSGPFAGVPFLIKDLWQQYAGFPTSNGSRALVHDVASAHALVTQRFLDAGLVIFGKTNTPELGLKGVTEPILWGPARNPWNLSHTPGGSSGGSGAAVAAGVVPAAGATDGGGSIRIPAACNGLVGLKTSRGLAPYGPQSGELVLGMGTHGVISRTVRDSARLLDAIIGPNPAAAYQAALPNTAFAELLTESPGSLRIGYSSASTIQSAPDPEAVAAVESAAGLLTELGHRVEEVSPPQDDEALARDFLTIWFAQVHGQVAAVKRRLGSPDSHFEPDTLAVAELGRASGVGALLRSLSRVNDHVRTIAKFHETYDLFLTPTLAKLPPTVGEFASQASLQRVARGVARARAGKLLAATGMLDQLIANNLSWVPYTQLANLTGRPAISVPMHWTASGLPLGIQLVGPLGPTGYCSSWPPGWRKHDRGSTATPMTWTQH